MFTRLASRARDRAKLSLYLAKASYCDFMRAYCEARELKSSIDDKAVRGQPAGPEEIGRLRLLTGLAEKCLRETVKRLDKLRKTCGEAVEEEVGEVVRMLAKKVEVFLDFRDEVESL